MDSDWSKINLSDLYTLNYALEMRIENDDGSVNIHLSPIHWSRMREIMHAISVELALRPDSEGGADG